MVEESKHFWDDYEPFGPIQDPESVRLDRIYDMLCTLTSRRQPTVELLVGRLSPTEQKLFEAASNDKPLTGENIAARTQLHDHNAGTKRALSVLVKLGLLKKVRGGYLRSSKGDHK